MLTAQMTTWAAAELGLEARFGTEGPVSPMALCLLLSAWLNESADRAVCLIYTNM